MKTLGGILLTTLLFVMTLPGEPAAPAVPPAMDALRPFAGTWTETEFVSKVAEWTPKEVRRQGGSATTQPILSGQYLVDDRTGSPEGSGHHGVWSWNAEEKAFHYTYFGGAGDRMELTGHWDAASKTMTTSGPMPNGVTMHGTIHFPDPNTKEWHVVATDAAGKVYLDMTSKETRAAK